MNSKSGVKFNKGIFLLNEGLPPTILESQVLTHVRALSERSIEMEVWAFAASKQVYERGLSVLSKLSEDHKVKIRLFQFLRPAFPFSHKINGLILLYWLIKMGVKPGFIHARTEYSTAVAATIKRLVGFKLIWDARGDTLSEFEGEAAQMQLFRRWLAPLKRRAIKNRLEIAIKKNDKAIFVSEALRNLYAGKIILEHTVIVPCLADEKLFYFDPELRHQTRLKLGYNQDHIVLMYAGSTASWQCVPETIQLMVKAIEASQRCRALIVTPEPEIFDQQIPRTVLQRFKVTKCTLQEMNSFLNVADVGIMLREDNRINLVASPVKFAEYSITGLRVVTSSAVAQVSVIGKQIGNLIELDTNNGLLKCLKPITDIERAELAKKAANFFSRKNHLEKITSIYQNY